MGVGWDGFDGMHEERKINWFRVRTVVLSFSVEKLLLTERLPTNASNVFPKPRTAQP